MVVVTKNTKNSAPRYTTLAVVFLSVIVAVVAVYYSSLSDPYTTTFLVGEHELDGAPQAAAVVAAAAATAANNAAPIISTRFTNDVRLNIDRGMNIVNCWSGHHMAAWVYAGQEQINNKMVTWKGEPEEKLVRGPSDAAKLWGDVTTLFVSFAKLEEFTRDFLPRITDTPFVLITVPFHIIIPDKELPMDLIARKIINHPRLVRWFSTNIHRSTGGHQYHPKVSPFPLGLKPKMGSLEFQNPVPYYRREFLKALGKDNDGSDTFTNPKTNPIYVGYISKQTNEGRSDVPSFGRKMKYPRYLAEVSKSSYVLSPDGLNPECHRHYESLGLGAVPITQLDPYLYSHLQTKWGNPAGVVFNNTDWNVTSLESSLPFPPPRVNRNIVFEEYWMEHVENVVGKKLWWWDVVAKKRSKLDGFATKAHNTTLDDWYTNHAPAPATH